MNKDFPAQRIMDFSSELLDEMATVTLDSKDLTPGESAEVFLGELDNWTSYYQDRADYFKSLKDELRQRIC